MKESMLRALWFQNFVVPILFLVVGVLANRLGRKDGDSSPPLNLCAAGTSILLMSLAATFTDLGRVSTQDTTILIWILVFMVMLFISIDFDRYGSWERDNEGYPTNRKHFMKGIVAPNIIGISLFIGYRFVVSGALA